MTTLAEVLLAPDRRDELVRRTAEWIERYVHERSGLKGLALRAGLSALQSARADALQRGVQALLPEFARALDPLYQEFRAAGGGDFSVFLAKRRKDAAAALMAVADARAARTSHRALAAGYRRLRGTLEEELRSLLPDISRMLSQAMR